jgi:TetR/AcrR family transcriptional regulator, mexJK operon transcriptional repressor
MSAIAALLGGSKGTLWSHFNSKETLFAAVLGRRADRFRLQLMEILDQECDLEITLFTFCRQYITLLCSPQVIATHRLVIGEASRFPELGKLFYDHAIGVTRAILCDFITVAIRRQLLEVSDAATAASLLTSLCHGRCFQQSLFGLSEDISLDEIDRDAQFAVSAFIKLFERKSPQDINRIALDAQQTN